MGGSVRKDLDEQFKVTHLIAKLYGGEKCHYAVTFNIPIMSENWIYDAWQNRNVVGFDAGDSDFVCIVVDEGCWEKLEKFITILCDYRFPNIN